MERRSEKSDKNNSKLSTIFSVLKKGHPVFQIRFKDRHSAAKILAALLQDKVRKELKDKENIVILGIPRGGVVVADIVAKKLKIRNFDIIIPRKLTSIHDKELSIGAIMKDGTIYFVDESEYSLQEKLVYLEQEKLTQKQEIKRREGLYRISGSNYNFLNNKIVILIDDGVASGATVIVAAKWIKKNYDIKKLIIAVPLVPKQSLERLEKECEYVVAVTTPKYFLTVEHYYQDFSPVIDNEVVQIIKSRI